MKSVTLAKQINRAFVWCLFIPMLAATAILISVFSISAKNEAVGKISADLKTALLLYHNSEQEMRLLAQTYSQQKAVSFLLPYAASAANVGLKVSFELARMARHNQLDMVSVVGTAGDVIACSHAPYQAKGTLLDKDYIRGALSGKSYGFTERISREELFREGITLPSPDGETPVMLSLTGVSPIYNSDQKQIIGAVILKKFIGNTFDLSEKITETIGLHVALFQEFRLISKAGPSAKTIEFISPSKPILESVYHGKQIVSTDSFYRGGHLSIYSQILDIDSVPVGIMMLQSGVQAYIRGRDTVVITLTFLLSIGVFLLFMLRKYITRQVIEPIYSLKSSAEEIGQGRYVGIAEVISRNEIGALTEAFNEMAIRLETTHHSLEKEIQQHHQSEIALQKAHDELERRVIERTADLSASNSQLKLENEERLAAEERLRSALAEKEVLLKEVHHRVKNNLQIVSSLLDMNRSRCADQRVSETLSGACARIHTMAMIHNQLCQSSRFDRINMQAYIQELAAHLSQVYGKAGRVSMDIRVENIALSLIQAMPCALIFNELISNSYKHAFKPDQVGLIAISMSAFEGSISVRFQDDGVGIPEEMDLLEAKSLGMKLINTLVIKQLKGNLRICRNPGTEIIFNFRVA